MTDNDWLTDRFEEQRPRLHAVAYRMLGSVGEAEDAVQEAWLRMNQSGADGVDNLPGWMTTVVARICLNVLRSRTRRKEEPLDAENVTGRPGALVSRAAGADPEQEALLADSVGLALLVVLDTLTPPERLAFVLHDLFDLPFDEIAAVVGRSPAATRQLASRARRRVRGGADSVPTADLGRQRRVVDAYLDAIRSGDLAALVRLLDPDVVLRADGASMPGGRPVELRGAELVARNALASSGRARFSAAALVDGSVGIVMAPRGRLFLVLRLRFGHGRITQIEVIADPDRLRDLDLAVAD